MTPHVLALFSLAATQQMTGNQLQSLYCIKGMGAEFSNSRTYLPCSGVDLCSGMHGIGFILSLDHNND